MALPQRWGASVALVLLLGTYWALSPDQLTLFPPVSEDEPWLAATSYKLATQGAYGNDLFAGYYGRARHDYSLTHLYGAFWLPALGLVLLVRRGRRLLRGPELYLLLAGFALPWLRGRPLSLQAGPTMPGKCVLSPADSISEPLTFDQALERVAPDVILVDRQMSRYLDELADPDHPHHERWLQFRAFLDRHQAILAAQVGDPTYGTMLIYRLDGMPDGSGAP